MHFPSFLQICSIIVLLINAVSCGKGNTWAVLHVGYNDYQVSYAMEAAVYRMYNILVRNNIPRSRIITISPDSVAYGVENPLQGVVVHATSGNPYTAKNQYEGIQIDYNPQDLTSDLFFEMMRGNKAALRNVTGSGKVLKTGPRDRVFVFTTSLGNYGALLFGPGDIAYANTFIPQLEKLKDEERFGKMLMVVDIESPGSMFDDYLDPSKNIIVYTTGGRHSSLAMVEKNDLLNAYTATLGSRAFLNSIEQFTTNETTIFDLYILARNEALISTDPSNLYGALRLGNEKISDFIGTMPSENLNSRNEIKIHEPIKSRSEGVNLHEAFGESGKVQETEEVLKNQMNSMLSK